LRPYLPDMTKNYKIEACVETFEEAQAAQRNGADQIELCGRLDLDGITPDRDLIARCKEKLDIDIKVMIRPRGGSFEYNEEEINQMKVNIDYCQKMEVDGVVLGILSGNQLDIDLISELAKYASPLKVTVHKAIDDTDDILLETKKLTSISDHVETILTSGGALTAEEGLPILKQMLEICSGQINIMPAGKITDSNLSSLHKELNTTGYHGRKIVGDLTLSHI